MPAQNSLSVFYYLMTLGVAMILRIMSLSSQVDAWNPDWIMLVIIYWSLAIPERFGVFSAWGIGLLTDVLTGRLLGQYGLIYALIAYFSIKEHRRLRQFPMVQQCIFVFICEFCAQSLIFGTESMKATNHLTLAFWYPLLTGTLAWPAVYWLLRYIRQAARIA